ncbi:MAG: hypothetical protein JXO72_07525 [Vicinamibacteria bacterium]|nr:hypothetical protein [Vicinamibacteria bacterium]
MLKSATWLLMAAAFMVAGMGLLTNSWAQGAFYREVVKDGRIHVFNNPISFEQFEGSGEVGAGAITLIGKGPQGETMVFDSENAIHMYNFKHDLPGEAFKAAEVPKAKPMMNVAWKDGKTTIETDKAALILSNRVQVRFTYEMPDDARKIAGTRNAGDPMGSFRIRRAKTKFEGWFYKKTLTYELQLNWPDTTNPLEDANLNCDVSGNKQFQVKLGQFKVPFGRQELTSSGSQQFVDRSIVSGEFAKGRDLGVQLWGLLAAKKLEWRLGAFNGNGRTKSANDNDNFQINGRVMFQPFGDFKYSESDFESVDKPLLAIAGNFEINDLTYPSSASESKSDVKDYTTDANGASTKLKAVSTTKATATAKRAVLGGDMAFKYKGVSVFVEYFDRKVDPFDGADFGASYKSKGLHAQAGYLFAKKKWEVAVRYATLDPTDVESDDDRTEIGGGVSYFYNKHACKVQADFRQIEDKAKKTKNNELRVQTQFIF